MNSLRFQVDLPANHLEPGWRRRLGKQLPLGPNSGLRSGQWDRDLKHQKMWSRLRLVYNSTAYVAYQWGVNTDTPLTRHP
jgi:hypothetical protein